MPSRYIHRIHPHRKAALAQSVHRDYDITKPSDTQTDGYWIYIPLPARSPYSPISVSSRHCLFSGDDWKIGPIEKSRTRLHRPFFFFFFQHLSLAIDLSFCVPSGTDSVSCPKANGNELSSGHVTETETPRVARDNSKLASLWENTPQPLPGMPVPPP